MSNVYKETWFIVPSRILDLKGMTFGYLKVYETIFQFWNKKQLCFLSNTAIQERTNVCLTDIKKALNFFEKCGELIRIQKGLKRFLTEPTRSVEVQEDATATCSTDIIQVAAVAAGGGRYSALTEVAVAATEIKNINKEINLSFGHSANDREKNHAPHQTFLRFWDAYPVKKGKHLALKAWIRLNPDEILIVKILIDLRERLLRDKEWIDECIPRPAKYLSERVFEDDIKHPELIKEKKKKESDKLAAQRLKIQDEVRINNENKQNDAQVFKEITANPKIVAAHLAGLKDFLKPK